MTDIHTQIPKLQQEILERKQKLEELIRELEKTTRNIAFLSISDRRYGELSSGREEIVKEGEEIVNKIEDLQKEMFYFVLKELDYEPHTSFFQAFSKSLHNSHKHLGASLHIGAFLLHGAVQFEQDYRGYSIDSIIDRLICLIPERIGDIHIVHSCSFHRWKPDTNSLLHNIASQLRMHRNDSIDKFINNICSNLSRGNVIFLIKGIDAMRYEEVELFIQQFWVPLARGVHNHYQELRMPLGMKKHTHNFGQHHLFMFLVDYSGKYRDMNVPCIEQPDSRNPLTLSSFQSDIIWKPDLPIRFSRVTNFSAQNLSTWLDSWYRVLDNILPDVLIQGTPEEKAQIILERSINDNPDMVMSAICDLFGYPIEGLGAFLRH